MHRLATCTRTRTLIPSPLSKHAAASPSSPTSPSRPLRRRRQLHLAPPFLLDDGSYIPRYQLLSSIDAAKKRAQADAHLRNCNLCPHLCGVNRYERTGFCLVGEKVKVSVIAPQFGEGGFFRFRRSYDLYDFKVDCRALTRHTR